MIRKLVFDKIKHTDTISYTFDGTNYESISASEALANGISIPDTCTNYDLIKIKGDSDNEISDFYYLVNSSNINNKSLWQNLKRIKIGNDVTSIENSAFDGCSSLTSITIPNSVTSIGSYAFCNCSNLTSITIPESVTSIEYNVFRGCSSLTEITIPNSVTEIRAGAFSNCHNLINIELSEDNSYFSVENQVLFDKNKSVIIYYFNSAISYEIPDSVTSIGNGAFRECNNLTSIVIPDSVTSIGTNAFKVCSNLASIIMSNSITRIEDSVFSECYSLASIIIPDSVTSIRNYAFRSCRSLTSIVIPDSVTAIGYKAFDNCISLASFTYEGTLKNWKNIIKTDMGLSQELIDNVTATLTAEAIAELESQTILLSDLSDTLTNSGIVNTPETAVKLHIIPAEGRTEWAYDPENSIDELQELSDIIAASGIYVDLTNTDLTHNTYTDIVGNLLYDEELATWEIQGYGYNNVDDSFTTEDLKPFPSVFRNNEYLVALTIPAGDNYSEDGVLAGCTNLKHISFAGDELWKIGIMGLDAGTPVDSNDLGIDFYFTYVGQENFIYPEETDDWVTVLDSEEEFINILINGYMVGQQNGEDKWHQASLMWYYDCWEDYEDNPEVRRPATNEIMLSGTRGLPNARILSLNEDVEVSDVEDIVSDGETEIAPAKTIEFDDNVIIENGEIHLDGSNSNSNE